MDGKQLAAVLRIKPLCPLRCCALVVCGYGEGVREADTASKDPLTRKVYDSYISFLTGIMDWDELSETGYRKTRRLALE